MTARNTSEEETVDTIPEIRIFTSVYDVTLDETEAIRQLKPNRHFDHVQEHKTSVSVCVEHISK
jgi:hypothetical protein